MDDEIDVMSILEDEDVILPGQFDYDIKESLEKITDMLEKMDSDAEKESKSNRTRFIIATVVSLIAAIASVIAIL